MDEGFFLAKISELTETDLLEISLSTRLSELSMWDSMAATGFVAFAAQHVEEDPVAVIESARTVGDLFELLRATPDGSGNNRN